MVGSDAVLVGEHPSPRTYGTFPVILSELVRMEGIRSLPDAIREMTSLPAGAAACPADHAPARLAGHELRELEDGLRIARTYGRRQPSASVGRRFDELIELVPAARFV